MDINIDATSFYITIFSERMTLEFKFESHRFAPQFAYILLN